VSGGDDAVRVVCAGDGFISADLLADAVVTALAGAGVPAAPEVVRLQSAWPEVPFGSVDGVREAAGDPAELAAAAVGAHAITTHLAPVTATVLESAADTLRVVGSVRGGPVNIDVEAATRLGVPVTYLPGRNLGAVAEFCVGTMICAMRGLPAASRRLAAGTWDSTGFRYERTGPELRAATVGLVGLGAVGMRVAELLQAFGSTVLAYDPYADEAKAGANGVRLSGLDELLAASDVVSLHARLTDDTRRMFDAGAFAAMKPGALFVNTARGELVDTVALRAALENGHLRGAVLDVFDPEPPAADDPLLGQSGVLATPHLAGASRQVAEESAAKVAAELARVLTGEQPLNCANPETLHR
jgi:D-3-phosphoglycerate dehydrogenase